MNTLKHLTELRAEKANQMEKILSQAKTENRAMNNTEVTKFDTLDNEIKGIDKTIEAEKRASEITDFKAPESKTEDKETLEERAFVDYILNNKTELRAGEIQLTQGQNGSIVPLFIANKIIKAVRDMVPFLQLSEVVSTNGKLSVPVYNETNENHINADYVDEGTDLTDNVGKFSTIDLTGYVIGALALVSNKLANNTDIDVVNFIVNQVAEAIAHKLENEFINGSTKITGITSVKNVVETGSSVAICYDDIVSLKHSLKQRFRKNGRFIMSPSTYTALCKLKDENGHPYFREDEYKILDCPVIESDSMPELEAGKKAIIFADLSGYTIKGTKKVEIKVLREKFATKNMLGVLAFCEYDAKITDNKKISALSIKE